jgi:DinB superfamily
MEKALREQLQKVLSWDEAHADWKTSVDGLSKSERGLRPPGAPHSAWELLEHMRIAQWDILNFCLDPKHVSPAWPSGYWPKTPNPPSDAAWKQSVESFLKDNEAMGNLVMDSKQDLLAPIAHGSGQTIFRQVLLLADHNSYHLGQFVLVRRLLGDWKEK